MEAGRESRVRGEVAACTRVAGDSQARFCEGLGVKFPGPTRPPSTPDYAASTTIRQLSPQVHADRNRLHSGGEVTEPMQGCADVFILYFPNKTRRICSGSFSYNMGPLLGREGVAQNIPSGRDDFLESPVGNAHRDSQNVNLIRLVLESAVQ
jgi:hypothetical protein